MGWADWLGGPATLGFGQTSWLADALVFFFFGGGVGWEIIWHLLMWYILVGKEVMLIIDTDKNLLTQLLRNSQVGFLEVVLQDFQVEFQEVVLSFLLVGWTAINLVIGWFLSWWIVSYGLGLLPVAGGFTDDMCGLFDGFRGMVSCVARLGRSDYRGGSRLWWCFNSSK